MRARKISVGLATLALLAAACSGGGATGAPSAATSAEPSAAASGVPSESASAGPVLPTEVGAGEGRLDLAVWPYYVVGGTGGEQGLGADWVTPFEEQTGCKVYAKVYGGSSDGVALMQTGEYDGGAFSGDATLRLVAGGDVAAVEHRPHPQLRGCVRRSQGPEAQHGRRRPLRSAPRSWSQPAHVADRRRAAGPG